MPKRFPDAAGWYIENLPGSGHWGWAVSDTDDFEDLAGWAALGGYRGNVIRFYDFAAGRVYQPFPQRRNVMYDKALWADGCCYFLGTDLDAGAVRLYRLQPGGPPETVTELALADLKTRNLRLIGRGVHIVNTTGSDSIFRCYYPERFEFQMEDTEGAVFMEENRVYTEAWVEEGWDAVNDRATDQYQFYDRVLVRDFSGRLLSTERGTLHQTPEGEWWIG